MPLTTCDLSPLGKREQPWERPPSFHAYTGGATPPSPDKGMHTSGREPSREQGTAGTRARHHTAGTDVNQRHCRPRQHSSGADGRGRHLQNDGSLWTCSYAPMGSTDKCELQGCSPAAPGLCSPFALSGEARTTHPTTPQGLLTSPGNLKTVLAAA